MRKPALDLLQEYRTNQNFSVWVGYVIVCLMMVCVAIGFSQLGSRLIPGWQGGYLVALGLLVSIESIYTRKQVRELETREKIIFRLSEWVAFAVAIKLLIYAVHGLDQLIADLPRWQENFLENFFTGEYVAALIITLVVWLSAAAYASELEELYDRESDASWDELGKLTNALQVIRLKITTRIFLLGTLVVVLAVLTRIDATLIFRETGRAQPGYTAPVANVLAYFFMALVLLSMTQFALLRTRWLWQRTPISPRIALNWLRFGALFFVILAVVVFFLPTEYSLGLFETLSIVVEFLLMLANALMFLLLLPFTICMSLFNASTNRSTSPQPGIPMVPPPVTQQANPAAWIEFLRSLAFWGIFLAIIFFAMRYYISQNAALLRALRAFPLVRWLGQGWEALRAFFRRSSKQISGLVKQGIERLRAKPIGVPTGAVRRFFNLARMTPRQRIIHFYVSLVEMGGERGLSRRPSQTPYQYESRLRSAIPEVDEELHTLTDTFLEARYSRHPLDEPEAEKANSLWERIKRVLKEWRNRG